MQNRTQEKVTKKSALYSLKLDPKNYHILKADFDVSLPLHCDTDS
jgi:hypothetical protein